MRHRLARAEVVVGDHRHRAGAVSRSICTTGTPAASASSTFAAAVALQIEQRIDPALERRSMPLALEPGVAVVVEDDRLVAVAEPFGLDAMRDVDEEGVAGDRRHDQADRMAAPGAQAARDHVRPVARVAQHRGDAGPGLGGDIAARPEHPGHGGGRDAGGAGDLGKRRRFRRDYHGHHTLAAAHRSLNRFRQADPMTPPTRSTRLCLNRGRRVLP